jgi:hypothetical protein
LARFIHLSFRTSSNRSGKTSTGQRRKYPKWMRSSHLIRWTMLHHMYIVDQTSSNYHHLNATNVFLLKSSWCILKVLWKPPFKLKCTQCLRGSSYKNLRLEYMIITVNSFFMDQFKRVNNNRFPTTIVALGKLIPWK